VIRGSCPNRARLNRCIASFNPALARVLRDAGTRIAHVRRNTIDAAVCMVRDCFWGTERIGQRLDTDGAPLPCSSRARRSPTRTAAPAQPQRRSVAPEAQPRVLFKAADAPDEVASFLRRVDLQQTSQSALVSAGFAASASFRYEELEAFQWGARRLSARRARGAPAKG